MSRPTPPRRPAPRVSRGVCLALVVALGATACTGDDEDDPAPGEPGASIAAEPLATTARLGEITGRLPQPRRQRVLRQAQELVDGWLDAAYVGGDYPRDDFDGAWPGFSDDARAQAEQDAALTSNAPLGERLESVEATRRRLVVDVLAVDGKPVGVTARIDLRLRLAGEVERIDGVRGRLLLTPRPQGWTEGWTIFGYDLSRGEVVAGRDGGQEGGRDTGKDGGTDGRKGGGR